MEELFEKIRRYVDEHHDDMLALWEEMVNTESGSRQLEGVAAMDAILQRELESVGAKVRVLPVENAGGVLVLGLLHPYTAQEGPEGRRRSVEQVKEFQRRFTQQFHLLNCRELLAERGLHPTPAAQAVGADDHCGTLIVSAVELLCDYLAELDGQK